jgi:hypothetical protein
MLYKRVLERLQLVSVRAERLQLVIEYSGRASVQSWSASRVSQSRVYSEAAVESSELQKASLQNTEE